MKISWPLWRFFFLNLTYFLSQKAHPFLKFTKRLIPEWIYKTECFGHSNNQNLNFSENHSPPTEAQVLNSFPYIFRLDIFSDRMESKNLKNCRRAYKTFRLTSRSFLEIVYLLPKSMGREAFNCWKNILIKKSH